MEPGARYLDLPDPVQARERRDLRRLFQGADAGVLAGMTSTPGLP